MCTITDNKLIAEFMGYPKKQINKGVARLEENKYVWGQTYYYINGDWHAEDYLLFHLDWNWLMQVVDKIESLGYCLVIGGRTTKNYCEIRGEADDFTTKYSDSYGDTKTQATYKAVIEFIKYYNNEN